MMNLRHLEVFYAIMRTGSVTGAARQLNVSQPAISSVLKHCEARMKIKLFKRVGGRLQPTPEAEMIFPDIAEIHGRLDAVERLMQDLAGGRLGTLSIAAALTIANGYVAKAVATFMALRPDVRVALYSMTSPQVVERVVNREVELGIAYEPVTNPEVETELLARSSVACVMREDHPLAAQKSIATHELAPYAVITYTSRGMLRSVIDRALEDAGIDKTATQVNLSLTAMMLAHHGAGVALVDPTMLALIPLQGLVARPLRPRIELNALLIRAKSAPRSAVMGKFVAHLKETVRGLTEK
ncbi:MAG: LysR family transcriptional regulator [Burkholderiales bacterium]